MIDAQERVGTSVRRQGPAALARASRRCTRPARSRRTSPWRRPGLDTLDILVLWKGFPTYASTQTIFTILKADWFYLEQNQYVQWDPLPTCEVVVPGPARARARGAVGRHLPPGVVQERPAGRQRQGRRRRARPDGHGGRRRHDRRWSRSRSRPLPADQQEAALAEIAGSVQAGMPPRENPRLNTSLDSVYASGPLGRAHCVIHGNCNYKQTGLLQAYAAYSLLQQPPRRAGFASGCQAFGHRELLGVLRSFGLVLEPVRDRRTD